MKSTLADLNETFEELQADGVIDSSAGFERYGVTRWNYKRLAFLALLCCETDHINDGRTWPCIDDSDWLLQRTFGLWKEHAKSHAIGRTLSGGGVNDNGDIAKIADYRI